MPQNHKFEPSNPREGDPSPNRPEFAGERQSLIDNIATLVVRQHRRRRLDTNNAAVKSSDPE